MCKVSQSIIQELTLKYPRRNSAVMPALAIVQQKNNNYLSREDISGIAGIFGVSKSYAWGVATYYTMYNIGKAGRYHIQIDTCVPAFLAGADAVLARLEEKLGIKSGQTTKDGMWTLSQVQDLASCGTLPVIQVNDRYYENITVEKVDAFIEALKTGSLPPSDNSQNVVTECKILLKNRLNPKAKNIGEYKKSGGYQAWKKARVQTPQDIVAQVKEANLKGRGGAGFATGVKWSFLPKDSQRPVYLIANADEGEPGTFKDRQIMEYDPHLLIEGIAISAYAIGAKTAFIYIRGEFSWIADILERAIKEAEADGQLEYVTIIVYRGAGSYVCGEETAQIESLEGKRGNPRVKPPFPANIGLYGCPTIINNVETLACVPFIVQKGVEEFKKIGVNADFGPKIYGVCGNVNKPGIFEYPLGTALKKIIEAAGGVKGKLKAVIVGGLSVPLLKADEIENLNMDYASCLRAGTMLGSGGIIVINNTVSIPELALRTIKFYAHESCGQCVPCRQGSYTIMKLLEKLIRGWGKQKDIKDILDLCKNIKGLTLCPVGDAFAMPIEAMIIKFREEFDALVK